MLTSSPRFSVRLALRLLFAIFCGVAAVSAQKASPASATASAQQEFHDIPYIENGLERQRLDLIVPPAPAGGTAATAHPLMIWIHGGGWVGGSYHGNPFGLLAAHGYVVASIGYRFSNQAVFPAQLEDCKAAVRWLRAHAGEFQIDPTRVGVGGASAGGHLSALLGTTGGTRQFDVGANLDQSSAVSCVIDDYGPTDFLHWGDPPLPDSADVPKTVIARLIGGSIHEHPDAARAASPIYYVDAHAAPFMIFQGDQDTTVPMQQSVTFDAALRAAGVSSTLFIVPGAGHGGPGFGDRKYLEAMATFLKTYLLDAPAGPQGEAHAAVAAPAPSTVEAKP